MLANGANTQAPLGTVKHKPDEKGGQKCKYHGNVYVQAGIRCVVKGTLTKELWELGDCWRHCSAIKQKTAGKQSNARCQKVNCNTRNCLVSVKRNRCHGVQKRNKTACNTCTKEANPRVSGEVAARNACKGANTHHALNTNVDNTGALGDNAAQSTKNKRCRVHEGNGNKKNQVSEHCLPPPEMGWTHHSLEQQALPLLP